MKDTNSASVAPSRESVADCIARLGPPPDDLWQQWLGEARRSIGRADSWSPNPDDPAWADWFVDENGQLVPDSSLVVDDRVNHRTTSTARAESESPGETSIDLRSDREKSEPKQGGRPSTERNGSKRKDVNGKLVAAAATVAVAAGLVIWVAFPTGPKAPPEIGAPPKIMSAAGSLAANLPTESPSPARGQERSTGELSVTEPIETNRKDEELETIMADVPDVADSIDHQLGTSGLSLDTFLPPEMLASTSPARSADSADSGQVESDGLPNTPISIDGSSTNESADEGASLNADETSKAAELFEDDPNAMDQGGSEPRNEADKNADEQATVTRSPIAAKTFGIVLPSIPSRDETPLPDSIELIRREEASGGNLPGELTLSFPTAANGSAILDSVRLESGDEPSTWNFEETDSSTTIAQISRSDDQASLRFSWTDAARRWSRAMTLTQGRITTDQGDTIFLRPSLDAEPIRLSLAKRDIKLKWNLRSPITTNATQLEMEVVVPKDVDLQWIEPIDRESPRSTRGVALLKLKKAEESAIVVRFDIKTTQSFSLRMRFGARLHSTMPWQWTDATSIRTSLAAVTNQLEAADRQLLDLDVAITRAERMRARQQEYLLEDQRDRIDEAVKQWTIVAKRLAELDQLVAFLEAGGEVRPKLSVTWPDQEQVLFGVND